MGILRWKRRELNPHPRPRGAIKRILIQAAVSVATSPTWPKLSAPCPPAKGAIALPMSYVPDMVGDVGLEPTICPLSKSGEQPVAHIPNGASTQTRTEIPEVRTQDTNLCAIEAINCSAGYPPRHGARLPHLMDRRGALPQSRTEITEVQAPCTSRCTSRAYWRRA